MVELFGAGFDDRDPRWMQQLARTQTYAVTLISAGKLVYRIDDTIIKLGKGDMLFIPSRCMREAYHGDDDYHQKYWATFVLEEPEDQLLPMLQKPKPFAVKTRQYEYMKQRFAQLIQQWRGKLPYYEQICSGIILDMLGRMNRELDARNHPMPMVKLITRIQDYILVHYREDIRVEQLARMVGRSPNYISSLFRRLTGQTVKEYINQVKLSAARDMLSHSSVNIGQAAEYVGFCDQAYFNRVFKKVYGFPPSVLLKERDVATGK